MCWIPQGELWLQTWQTYYFLTESCHAFSAWQPITSCFFKAINHLGWCFLLELPFPSGLFQQRHLWSILETSVIYQFICQQYRRINFSHSLFIWAIIHNEYSNIIHTWFTCFDQMIVQFTYIAFWLNVQFIYHLFTVLTCHVLFMLLICIDCCILFVLRDFYGSWKYKYSTTKSFVS